MKSVRLLHKVMGILLGIPVLISAITGAIYIWHPEITKSFYPSLMVENCGEKEIDPIDLVNQINFESDKEIIAFYYPERERGSYCVKFVDDENYYFYHPVTGNQLGALKSRRGWLDTLLAFHTFKYLKNGNIFIATIALLLSFFILTTGVLLWKPRGRKIAMVDFRIQKQSWQFPSLFFVGHRVIGIYSSILIFVIATSGAYFSFRKEYKYVLGAISGQVATLPATIQQNDSLPIITMDNAIKIANQNFKEYIPRSIILPKHPNKHAYISWMKSREIENGKRKRPYLYIAPQSGEIIYRYTPNQTNVTDEIVNSWIPQLHFGEWGGLFTRIIYCLVSLFLALLIISGCFMTFYKLKRNN